MMERKKVYMFLAFIIKRMEVFSYLLGQSDIPFIRCFFFIVISFILELFGSLKVDTWNLMDHIVGLFLNMKWK